MDAWPFTFKFANQKEVDRQQTKFNQPNDDDVKRRSPFKVALNRWDVTENVILIGNTFRAMRYLWQKYVAFGRKCPNIQ